jgi:exosome complex component RRP45
MYVYRLLLPYAPAYTRQRPTEQEILLSRHLEKSIRRSNALDTESLCLQAGRACWSILCTLHVVSCDGNLQDCACVAAVAALKHFRRPDVSIEGEQVTVYTMAERVPVPLSVLHTPISITFAFLQPPSDTEAGEMVIILDPTLAEESVKSTSISITANGQGEICHIAQLGGEPVDAVTLLNCSEVAVTKAAEMGKWLEGNLRADLEKRDGKAQKEGRAVDER